MAPRAIGFARKAAAEETQSAEELANEVQDLAPDPIPLALAPLIAPYKKRGRVKLRIERLPRRARLSQGQNNGDGSWSLMLDELEDLQYLPPDGSTEASVLGIRVLRVEAGDATTLAVLDYALPAPSRSAQAGAAGTPSGLARKSSDDAELRRLRSELAKAQSSLSVRESELTAARRDAEEARSEISRQAIDRELAAARSEWEAELEQRVASAASGKSEDLQKSRESWRRETEAALARAERDWKTAEAARLAVLETQWNEKTSRSLAQLRVEADSLRSDGTELTALRENTAALQSALSRAEGELAKARVDGAAAEDRTRKGLAQARAEADALRGDGAELAKLRQKIEALQSSLNKREGEFARLRTESTEAEARAQKDLAQAHAEADARRGDGAELAKLRQKIEALQSSLNKREGEFATLRTESTEAEARARKDLAQARAEAEARRGDDGELGRLRERLDRLQTSLALRDQELAQARDDVVEAENRGRKEVETALARAEKAWKEEEAARLQAAETRWNELSARSQVRDARSRQGSRCAAEEPRQRPRTRTEGSRRTRGGRKGRCVEMPKGFAPRGKACAGGGALQSRRARRAPSRRAGRSSSPRRSGRSPRSLAVPKSRWRTHAPKSNRCAGAIWRSSACAGNMPI